MILLGPLCLVPVLYFLSSSDKPESKVLSTRSSWDHSFYINLSGCQKNPLSLLFAFAIESSLFITSFHFMFYVIQLFFVFLVRCADDARVDYDSLLDSDQRRSRFSEQLLDLELRESVRLGKMYRQLQRQINCRYSVSCRYKQCVQIQMDSGIGLLCVVSFLVVMVLPYC